MPEKKPKKKFNRNPNSKFEKRFKMGGSGIGSASKTTGSASKSTSSRSTKDTD